MQITNFISKKFVLTIIAIKFTILILTSSMALRIQLPSLNFLSSLLLTLSSLLLSTSSSSIVLPLAYSTFLQLQNYNKNCNSFCKYYNGTDRDDISIQMNFNNLRMKINNNLKKKNCKNNNTKINNCIGKKLNFYEIMTKYNSTFNFVNKEKEKQEKNKKKENGNRKKRFLIFNMAGIVKLVFGFSQSVNLGIKNRQMNHLWNFQMQYMVPKQPMDLYASMFYSSKRSLPDDSSRKYIYEIIETVLTHMGFDGKHCLLKLICDVSKEPINGDSIFHQVLNAIMSPSEELNDNNYLEAKNAGLQWANCSSCYHKCIGFNLLEKYSIYL